MTVRDQVMNLRMAVSDLKIQVSAVAVPSDKRVRVSYLIARA